jgi:MYXO-CTERM domain-containing protein
MKALLRAWLASVLGSAVFTMAPLASADGEPCINDIDCPGAECGGAVCNWDKPQGDRFTCNPAGSQPKGEDGWCSSNSDCKCASLGATCATAPYCTFTKPSEAPAGGGSGAGGSASTAGTTAMAGTTSTAGMAGGATKPPAEEESGGCSVASPASTGGGIALTLGLLGVGAAFARRRRS